MIKKPTHVLKFLDKNTNERGIVGAGWQNEDESISIVLNSKVVLTQNTSTIYTLFHKNLDK